MVKIDDQLLIPPSHLKALKTLNKNYTFGKVIGIGKYGVVCGGTMGTGDKKVQIAVKVIDLKKTSNEYKNKFLPNELWALEEFKHPYIVTVHSIKPFDTTVYVFMEMAFGGDLLNMLDEKVFSDGIPENRTKPLYKMIASALKYIHDRGAAHRDVKSENILLMNKERTIAKLTDFGFSTTCIIAKTNQKLLRETYCGTPFYSPPEVERHQPYDAMKADVWSLGVVFYTMLQKELPFSKLDVENMVKEPTKPPKIEFKNKNLSKDCKDLITKQLEIDPKKRLTVAKVLEHQWFISSVSS